jgi:type I restriction enzyme S subunit
MNWHQATLQDLVFFQRGFDITKAEQKPGTYPVISSAGTTSYHNEFMVSGPGVIIGRKGSLGTVHFSEGDYWPHDTTLWSKDFRGNDPRFVYYFMHTLGLSNFDVGGANPTLNRNHIHKLVVSIPPLPVQRNIASILSTYDDLIAANQRRIKLLEESARLLYREWFVKLRFPGHETTPVRPELVEGRFDEGLNVLRQAQHERCEVPEGWSKLPLSELADVIMGQSPESKHFNTDGEGLPFHQGVSDFSDRFVTHSIFSTHATRIAQPGDILCSVRAPVGRLNVTLDKIIIGRGLSAIRSKMGTQSMLFYQMKNLFFQEDLIGGGAIFASVGKKELFGQELLQPSEEIAGAFENFASGVDQQIEALTLQIRRLQEARDMLLPKLMSGALDVSRIVVPREAEA